MDLSRTIDDAVGGALVSWFAFGAAGGHVTRSNKSLPGRRRKSASSAEATTVRTGLEARRAETGGKPVQLQRAGVHREATRPEQDSLDGATELSADERRALVEQAAYFRAQRRGFGPGHELDDWIAAEREIEQFLADSASLRARNPRGESPGVADNT
jgi:hypothetical protein